MPYLTGQEFISEYIGDTVASQLFPGTGAAQEAAADRAMLAASGMIDAAAHEGGFPTPLEGAELATGATEAKKAESARRIDALVQHHCAALGTGTPLTSSDEKKSWERARAACEAWLKELKQGKGIDTGAVDDAAAVGFAVVEGPGSINLTVGVLRCGRAGGLP